MNCNPILAMDVDSVIGLLFAVIWVVGWLFKVAVGQSQKAPPVANRPRPPVRPRDDKLQDEIDTFIQEVGAKKPARRPPPPQRAPTPAPARSATASPGAAADAGRKSQRPPKRVRPGQEIASRHIPGPERTTGAAVQQHLQQHMAERMAQQAATFLPHSVDQSVAAHLGPDSASGSPVPAQKDTTPALPIDTLSRPNRFTEMFRNPVNMRQAMLVNLILSPPPGRKPRPPVSG